MRGSYLHAGQKYPRQFWGALLLIAFGLLTGYFYATRQPRTELTRDFLKQAYLRYSAYQENFLNIDSYLHDFPVAIYSRYKVEDYSFFLEKEKFDFIKYPLRLGRRWEPYLLGSMAKYVKKGSEVVDVGAHIGSHTLYFSRLVGDQGTVYAFEPQKKIYVELNANLLLNHANNVKTYRYALGDKKAIIEMNRASPENEGGTAIGKGGDQADMLPLDSFNLQHVSFIKIDVEGYEDHVLDGARKTILANRPVILCEIQGSILPEDLTPADKAKIKHTLAKLHALGYKTFRIKQADYLALPV